MQEMQVQSLGWEDNLEEGMATHFVIPTWRIPRTEKPQAIVPGITESDMPEQCTHAKYLHKW